MRDCFYGDWNGCKVALKKFTNQVYAKTENYIEGMNTQAIARYLARVFNEINASPKKVRFLQVMYRYTTMIIFLYITNG